MAICFFNPQRNKEEHSRSNPCLLLNLLTLIKVTITVKVHSCMAVPPTGYKQEWTTSSKNPVMTNTKEFAQRLWQKQYKQQLKGIIIHCALKCLKKTDTPKSDTCFGQELWQKGQQLVWGIINTCCCNERAYLSTSWSISLTTTRPLIETRSFTLDDCLMLPICRTPSVSPVRLMPTMWELLGPATVTGNTLAEWFNEH